MDGGLRRVRENADYSAKVLTICGHSFVADHSGALFCPERKTLIVADLHLEKGSSYAARGSMVPPYDTRSTLAKLAAAVAKYNPETIIALGDSFHDGGAGERMMSEDLSMLRRLQQQMRWIWVLGNHDTSIPEKFGGEVCETVAFGHLWLRHIPSSTHLSHEIAGHLHPQAHLSFKGNTIRRACFISNGHRLVMPAFGAFTGGLDVFDQVFQSVFPEPFTFVLMLGETGIYPVPYRGLKGI